MNSKKLKYYTRYVVKWGFLPPYGEEQFNDLQSAEHFYNVLDMNAYPVELRTYKFAFEQSKNNYKTLREKNFDMFNEKGEKNDL